MEKAGIGARVVGFVVDGLITGAAALFLGMSLGMVASFVGGSSQGMAAVVVGIQFLFPIAVIGYFTYFEGKSGQTPGKKVVDIKVTRKDGGDLDMKGSAIRNILRIVDALPAFYIVGLISIALTENSQRIGDIAANTVVVDE